MGSPPFSCDIRHVLMHDDHAGTSMRGKADGPHQALSWRRCASRGDGNRETGASEHVVQAL